MRRWYDQHSDTRCVNGGIYSGTGRLSKFELLTLFNIDLENFYKSSATQVDKNVRGQDLLSTAVYHKGPENHRLFVELGEKNRNMKKVKNNCSDFYKKNVQLVKEVKIVFLIIMQK